MKVVETGIDGLVLLEPKAFGDDRGYFMESYNRAVHEKAGLNNNWVQDNEAFSSKGVLRGLHYQTGEYAQAKLVRVTHGTVLDVVVDIRPESKTYGETYSVLLSEENKKQLLVPRGFAHGYVVLSETALFQYKCDNFYAPDHEGGIIYNDARLSIDWVIPMDQLTISEKDKLQPIFGEHKPI